METIQCRHVRDILKPAPGRALPLYTLYTFYTVK